MDLKFDEIILKLKQIHETYPDLKFGEILQLSLDNKKKKFNQNFSNSSSKEILNSLEEFEEVLKIKKRKKVDKHDIKNLGR